jgi:hypothetical protein
MPSITQCGRGGSKGPPSLENDAESLLHLGVTYCISNVEKVLPGDVRGRASCILFEFRRDRSCTWSRLEHLDRPRTLTRPGEAVDRSARVVCRRNCKSVVLAAAGVLFLERGSQRPRTGCGSVKSRFNLGFHDASVHKPDQCLGTQPPARLLPDIMRHRG